MMWCAFNHANAKGYKFAKMIIAINFNTCKKLSARHGGK
jgi:hypothetical protein